MSASQVMMKPNRVSLLSRTRYRRLFKRLIVSFALVYALLFTTSIFAQQAAKKPSEQAVYQITHEVSNEVLSPFCPGKTLAMCPSPAAGDARRAIQAFAEQGLSKEEIKDRLIEQYGPEFRRVTPGHDDNLVVFVLIGIGLIICAGFIYYLTTKNRRKDGGQSADIDLPDESLDESSVDDESDYLDELRRDYQS